MMIATLFARPGRAISRLRSDRRGTAVLEMGIMAPTLLVIGLGVMEFGNLMYKRHLIENGIRDAARYIAGQPTCNTAAGAALATTGTIDGSGAARVENWSLPPGDIACVSVPATYGAVTLRGSMGGNLQVVRINTQVTYGALSLGFLDVLDRMGTGFSSTSFPVQHEERYYGNR